MINDGPKRLVVVAVGITVISYDAVYPGARIEREIFLCFFGLFWDILQHNGHVT